MSPTRSAERNSRWKSTHAAIEAGINYLAHLYFALPTPESMVGNLLPDFTGKIAETDYPAEVMQGVRLHRFIDAYTDSHPIVRQSKKRISLERRRFAPIMIDIFYDHFLALHWERYSTIPLRESTQAYYDHLLQADMPLPERLSESIQRMPQIDLLYNYRTLKGIEHALDRVAQRIRFKNNLHGSIEELEGNFSELEADFHRFFEALRQAVTVYQAEG